MVVSPFPCSPGWDACVVDSHDPSRPALPRPVTSLDPRTTPDTSPARQNVVWTLSTLPWCFKVVYGFMSDMFPIHGMKRKPYFAFGWTVYVLANLMVALSPQPT